MNYIRKIFHPLIPFLVLLLIFAKISYDHFLKLEDYTDEEEKLLAANIDELREQTKNNIHTSSYYNFFPTLKGNDCGFDSPSRANEKKINSLAEIYERYSKFLKEEGYQYIVSKPVLFGNNQYRIDGAILDLFNKYTTDISKVDSTLLLHFKDYKFNNGISETEIQRLYVSTNKKDLLYILALFEVELALIYNHAIEEFTHQKVYLSESEFIRNSTQIVPILNTDSSFLQVKTPVFLALDTSKTVIRSLNKLNKIKYLFSEDNCYVVLENENTINIMKKEGFYFTMAHSENGCDTTLVYRNTYTSTTEF